MRDEAVAAPSFPGSDFNDDVAQQQPDLEGRRLLAKLVREKKINARWGLQLLSSVGSRYVGVHMFAKWLAYLGTLFL